MVTKDIYMACHMPALIEAGKETYKSEDDKVQPGDGFTLDNSAFDVMRNVPWPAFSGKATVNFPRSLTFTGFCSSLLRHSAAEHKKRGAGLLTVRT